LGGLSAGVVTLMQIARPNFQNYRSGFTKKHAISSEKIIFFLGRGYGCLWQLRWLSPLFLVFATGRRLWMTMNSEYFQLAGTLEVGTVRRAVQTCNAHFTVDDVYQRSSDCNVNVSL